MKLKIIDELKILNNKMIIANNTTNQYFRCKNESDRDLYLRDLINPLTRNDKLNNVKFRQGHWNKSDHIILVEPRLEVYVVQIYSEIFMH